MSVDKKYTKISIRPRVVTTFPELEAIDVECFYIEDFFTKKEADVYLATLLSEYPFHQEKVSLLGKVFDQPRLTRFMGEKGKSYYYSGFKRDAVSWIPSALEIRDRVMEQVLQLRQDHPLLDTNLGNHYRDGKDYVGWHSDDVKDLYPNAFIASVSFGSERDFDIRLRGQKSGKLLRVNLKHGSLFLMGKNFQQKTQHTIAKRLRVKEPRVNLTLRSLRKSTQSNNDSTESSDSDSE